MQTAASLDSAVSETLNLDNIELIPINNLLNCNQEMDCQNIMTFDEKFELDADDSNETNLIDMENIPIINNHLNGNDNLTGIELVNYNVEMMDSFKLNDQIELCDEEILPKTEQNNYFGMDSIHDMADINCWSNDSNEFLNLCQNDILIEDFNDNGTSNMLAFSNLSPVKKFMPNTVSVNSISENVCDVIHEDEDPYENRSSAEIELFTSWSNSIIERLNMTMDFNDDGQPDPLIFSVSHVSLLDQFTQI